MLLTSHPHRPRTLVTTYLEMVDRGQFKPTFVHDDEVSILPMETPDPSFYMFLYRSVGEGWSWRDRLLLSRSELCDLLSSPNRSVYVMYVSGIAAGYVELDKQGDSVEIAYFGLREEFMGRGLGKHLLSYGISQAWKKGARRVWLHTCNLDSPHAMSNYLKRGFAVYQTHEEPMPQRYQ